MTLLLMLALAGDVAALEERMVELINVERDARGIPPLELHPRLSQVAREYSGRMAASGRVDHELEGSMEERIREALPDTCRFGENISKNTSVDYALSDLMTSKGHRANLLDPRFSLIGIGIVRGDGGYLYITQEFSRRCGPRPRR
jgi:uncharacterized protein YkwD